jgi:hypothetical protein
METIPNMTDRDALAALVAALEGYLAAKGRGELGVAGRVQSLAARLGGGESGPWSRREPKLSPRAGL